MTRNHPIYSPNDCKVVNHYYEAIQFTVSNNGCYTFISKSNVNIAETVYIHSFEAANPITNWIANHHGNKNNDPFNFTLQLENSFTYVLVVSMIHSYDRGNFSVNVSGSGKIDFNRLSKYCVCKSTYFLNRFFPHR